MVPDDELHARLREHLERTYGIDVRELARLQAWNPHVHRVDHRDGGPWVARVFPPERPVDRIAGDAEILRRLEAERFPAERLAAPDPVTVMDGRGILVTRFIEGTEPDGDSADTQGALAALLGRLATLPSDDGAAARDAGAWGGDPRHEGRPREDIEAARELLDEIEGRVPAAHLPRFDSLRRQVEVVDDLEGLPEALLHPDVAPVNARVASDGSIRLIDWTAAGRGPRIAALGWFLGGVRAPGGYDRRKLDAVARGYGAHVRLEPEELDRLPDAMRIRALFFACFHLRHAIVAGSAPTGPGATWCTDEDNECGHRIAAALRERTTSL